MKLSRTERWMLANQYRILAALHPQQAEKYNDYARALERGYTRVIDAASAHILRDDTDEKESQEVDEVIAMFDALQRSLRLLDDPEDIDEWALHFPGFDQDTEADYLGYAHYVVAREGRYPHLVTARDLNTHKPMLKQYRRMLDEWKRRGRSATLDRRQILGIIEHRTED
jgi:uncharacterized protein YfbU (UPF0304 family)